MEARWWPIGDSGSMSTATVASRYAFFSKTYQNFRHNFGMGLRPSGIVTLNFNAGTGGTVDFANARKATQLRIGPSLGLKLGRSLSANLSHNYQKLTSRGRPPVHRQPHRTARRVLHLIAHVREGHRPVHRRRSWCSGARALLLQTT